jgi:hypothetical protein
MTPENTWFHTALVQRSTLLLRVIHCCCDPLTTIPFVNAESAMKPPLANDGGVQ